MAILIHLRRLPVASMLLSGFLLGACSRHEPEAEPVRPVRIAILGQEPLEAGAEFPGEVRPRYESRLGFRVAGKITTREVEVGSAVRRGQVLMRLDPQDLRLAASQAQASLRAAETNRELAEADYARYKELRGQNFVSQSVLDTKRSAMRAARAEADAARAAFRGQANQAGYASLVSDVDGVVTGIDAEAGQVVAAGTPVVRVARLDALDVVIGIPEDRVDGLRMDSQVAVRLWADPDETIRGRVREVSPAADPATRTYTVRVAIPPQPDVRLGMTATVRVASNAEAGLRAPLSSLHYEAGSAGVWLVERGAVRRVPVQVLGQAGNDVLLGTGVQAGQAVVTAGVNLLRQGQKVRVLQADVARRGDTEAAAVAAPASAPGAAR
ncbi:efflux RND transporter periplasmic adaptor subunit [Massilia sp. Mn16-1_5]|uniref:efflux RND transporter periplasmic adaptor subunit n=1 Tax=Massilia sp. Mn16-1_5 TaxID=2079199 RepID=UPI001E5C844F|nr:efflux RND transporter periplasmic adaptor subunit [Massilia sp. Mn16-1_5]